MVEENNSKSMVIFRDETARREYQELKNEQEQRIKRQKSIENQKKQIQESEKMKKYVGEASSKFNYSDFYSPIGTVPVDEIEDRGADRQRADRGRRIGAEVACDGRRDDAHEGHRDVRDDVGHRQAEDFAVHLHAGRGCSGDKGSKRAAFSEGRSGR